MTNPSKAMLSRSVRLPKSLIEELQKQAELKDIGITVHIREVLEAYVSTSRLIEEIWTSEALSENV
jgi:hypothetical protein